MSNETTMPLEQRIAATLLNANAASSDLTILLEEVEAALADADEAAKNAHERAFDLIAAPDAAAARETMEAAEFTAARLRAALPKLKRKFAATVAHEYALRWDADYRRVQAKVDEAARRFAEYPEIVAELITIFCEAQEIDKEIDRINGAAPSGEPRRLRYVELVARGLERFTRSQPSLAHTVQLPDWEHSELMTWPPRRQLDVSLFAPVPHDPRYSADWSKAREDRAQAVREEQERVAAYYEEQQRAMEDREKDAR